jgi:hypothetical protein
MRAEPVTTFMDESTRPDPPPPRWCGLAVALAALVGLGLMADSLGRNSATYDEVAYLRIAAHWWRTGDQVEITRMGSPLTFWKLQQVPVLWTLDRLGLRAWVDDPIGQQARLLPVVRLGGLWIWLVAFGLTALWSRQLYGLKAMALAAWLFALGPNLLAHGPLATMETPLLAALTGIFWLFWRFLQTKDRRFFWASAALGGLAWSCKFTTVLVPPLLGLAWWLDRWKSGERGAFRITSRVLGSMGGFVLLMLAANLVVTGFAMLPLSSGSGAHPSLDGRFGPLGRWVARGVEMPIPQDWVGFATQVLHQRSGGSSYLFGERRMTGWWYYYFVVLAVKVPLTFWVLVLGRAVLGKRLPSAGRAGVLPLWIAAFLAASALGSTRNYGLRYVLPLAPLAIVWVSGLAESGRWAQRAAWIGLVGQAAAVAAIHPHELTYFNALAGGPLQGRHILADSNLDWGQGLRSLARLQQAHPEWRDLTLYYFGDTEPAHYGVAGTCHVIDAPGIRPGPPPVLSAKSAYLAVSASLQWGPWGPEGYFRRLDALSPIAMTDDRTIAIYRVAEIPGGLEEPSRGDLADRREDPAH